MNYTKALLYGLGVWVIPFVVAMLVFPLRANERPLFESVMPVAVTAATVFFGHRYLRRSRGTGWREGLSLGLVFLVVSLVIDLLMFSWGPMKMAFADYVKDIGLTYLLMPIVTAGMAAARVAQQSSR
jgi:integral membrane sensor domain MASE1